MRILLALVLAAAVLLPAVRANTQDQPLEWLSYYPSVARISGKVVKVQKFGKPSYGENPEKDQKIEVAVLILPTPIRVKANPSSSVNNEAATNVSFVQLIFPSEMGSDYWQYLDQTIVAAGNLIRGHKGDHFTDVVMEVKVVNPTGKPM